MDHRWHKVQWGPGKPRVRTSLSNWKEPISWNANALSFELEHGRRRRVFCASLADVFDNEVPAQWRLDLWKLIESTPKLDWLILTKRIGNVSKWTDVHGMPTNVWLGISVVNQEEADRDIPKLDATMAVVRWLSMEPLLGPVTLGGEYLWGSGGHNGIDWVVCGGESGKEARPMHPDWARALRDECKHWGVPFLFKQWGEWTPGENVEQQRGTVETAFLDDDGWRVYPLNLATDEGHIDDQPDLYRVGKRAAGRFLDGVLHDGYPS